MNKPSIGRIVIYKTTEPQQKAMETASALGRYGNVSKEVPAVIVAVWSPTCVNLKVLLDGQDNLWVTSANEGDQPGNWSWPVKVE